MLHTKEIESVLSLPKEKLFKTFLLRVADSNQVWVLDDDGFVCSGDDEGNQYLPLWPEKEFAQLCAIEEWKSTKPLAIDLEEFLTEYIPDFIESGIYLSIFPRTNHKESIIFNPKEFALAMASYMEENYGDEFDLPYLK